MKNTGDSATAIHSAKRLVIAAWTMIIGNWVMAVVVVVVVVKHLFLSKKYYSSGNVVVSKSLKNNYLKDYLKSTYKKNNKATLFI